jgi:hypothetical protein
MTVAIVATGMPSTELGAEAKAAGSADGMRLVDGETPGACVPGAAVDASPLGDAPAVAGDPARPPRTPQAPTTSTATATPKATARGPTRLDFGTGLADGFVIRHSPEDGEGRLIGALRAIVEETGGAGPE